MPVRHRLALLMTAALAACAGAAPLDDVAVGAPEVFPVVPVGGFEPRPGTGWGRLAAYKHETKPQTPNGLSVYSQVVGRPITTKPSYLSYKPFQKSAAGPGVGWQGWRRSAKLSVESYGTDWARYGLASPPRLLLSVPPITCDDFDVSSGDGRECDRLPEVPTGAFDAHYRYLADLIFDNFGEQTRARVGLKIGHEFNIRAYAWNAVPGDVNGPNAIPDFVAAYRHVHGVIVERLRERAVAAGRSTTLTRPMFIYNLAAGANGHVVEPAFPGRAFADVLGVDVYGGASVTTTMQGSADGKQLGLRSWAVPFAQEHSMYLAIDEWNLKGRIVDGNAQGPDSPEWITAMYQFADEQARAGRLLWHVHFEVELQRGADSIQATTCLLMDASTPSVNPCFGAFPNARVRFLQLYGPGGPPPIDDPPPVGPPGPPPGAPIVPVPPPAAGRPVTGGPSPDRVRLELERARRVSGRVSVVRMRGVSGGRVLRMRGPRLASARIALTFGGPRATATIRVRGGSCRGVRPDLVVRIGGERTRPVLRVRAVSATWRTHRFAVPARVRGRQWVQVTLAPHRGCVVRLDLDSISVTSTR